MKRLITPIFLALFVMLTGCNESVQISPAIQNISISDYLARQSNENVLLIDSRDSNFFNGWPEAGARQGGHIPDARNFAASWLSATDAELQPLMNTKQITADKTLVIYGDNARLLADWLVTKQQFSPESIFILEQGFEGWLQQNRPVESLPGFDRLIPPHQLAKLAATDQPPVIVDVSWGLGVRYLAEHIPGAIHVDTGLLESEPLWNLRSPQELKQTMQSLGITPETAVVVYGEDMTAAARMVFTLKHIGVNRVKLLNGGLKAWKAAGLPLERGKNEPVAAGNFDQDIAEDSDILFSTDEVKALLAEPEQHWLVSIRSWPEYIGETSGYNYIKPKGRIAGAHWGHAGSDPWHMEDYLNPDGTLRESADLLGYWSEFGATTDDTLVFYCGTGWRASLSWFAAELAGIKKTGVYDGGWMEWSSDPERPQLVGEPVNPAGLSFKQSVSKEI